MLAHYTNGNVLTIQKILRHKNIQDTLKYIHTVNFKNDDFEIATATSQEEVKQLRQDGFVKYDEMNGIHFYRKPKKLGVYSKMLYLKVLKLDFSALIWWAMTTLAPKT